MDSPVLIHTIVYSEESYAALEEGFLLLDYRDNVRPDWREYWPIRRFLLSQALVPGAYYGFFSPKFSSKTGLSHGGVVRFMASAPSDTDVFTFSPQPDMGAFFLNVFEQNELFDPGFLTIAQELFTAVDFAVDLRSLVMDSRHVVFSNYVVAKSDFWLVWLELCEKIFDFCERGGTELAAQMCDETTYQGIPRKVFLIERIASLLLRIGQWQIKPYDTFACAWSALGTSQFQHEAVISDALKFAYNELGHPEYFSGFSEVRNNVFFQNRSGHDAGFTADSR